MEIVDYMIIITKGDVKSGLLQSKSYTENQLKWNKTKKKFMTQHRYWTTDLKLRRRALSQLTQLDRTVLKRPFKLCQVIVYVHA